MSFDEKSKDRDLERFYKIFQLDSDNLEIKNKVELFYEFVGDVSQSLKKEMSDTK